MQILVPLMKLTFLGKIKSLNESALNSYLSTKYAANNAKNNTYKQKQ